MRFFVLAVAFSSGFAAQSANAEARDAFPMARVSDFALAGVHGAGLTQLSRVALASDDAQASLFRQTADVGRIMLDDWWAQPGAALIASSMTMGVR